MMTTMTCNNFTSSMSHAADRSAMGSFCEPSANASMNIVLSLDAAILAASIIFIMISRMIIGIVPS